MEWIVNESTLRGRRISVEVGDGWAEADEALKVELG